MQQDKQASQESDVVSVGRGQASLENFANFALQSEDPIHAELNQHEWGLLASRLRQEPTSSAKLAGE